jgi:exoribonuclease R
MGDRRNTGHFGLGVADYVHSTAPNRRFVDLITQRLLKAVMAGSGAPYSDDALIEIARRCTDREDAARKVERTMRKVAAATLFASRVGERFAAIITGASPKGVYARVLSVPIEGRVVRGSAALDVGATVQLTLVSTNPQKGHIDFAYEEGEATRKLERTRRKKAAAERLRTRVGESFQGRVTGASEKGVYVRLVEEDAEGRVIRGYKGLEVGMTVPVTLVNTDTVHGFIDFEHGKGIDARKLARAERKREAARMLQDRIGEEFHAVVTGISVKATWMKLDDGTEGRLVRGAHSLSVGEGFVARLLTADPKRGFIDFARDDSPYSD